MVRTCIERPEGSPLTDAEWGHLGKESRKWIATIVAEWRAFRARAQMNSTNSSKPPSSDPPNVKKRARAPSGRSPGGQLGHPGRSRSLVPLDRVSAIEDVYPKRCWRCGSGLSRKHGGEHEPLRHQVAEIPAMEPDVTEYRRHQLDCLECGAITTAPIPDDVPKGNFGPNLRAFLALLSGRFRLSRREVVEFCGDALGLSISVGCLDNMCHRVGDALEEPMREIGAHLQSAPMVHTDESGWSQRGIRHWIWVVVTVMVAYFRIARSRGSQVVKEVLGEAFSGDVVSDRWAAYLVIPPERRQVCWAHLKRDLQGFIDRGGRGRSLGEEGVCLVKELFSIWHSFEQEEITPRQMQRKMKRVEDVFVGLLEEGLTSSDRKARGFCKKLLELKPALFLFARKPGIEPTNNPAERALRPVVLWRKGSFGTCSEQGSRFVERMMTVVMTCRIQGRSVLSYLQEVCAAQDRAAPIPSLLRARARTRDRPRIGAARTTHRQAGQRRSAG